MMRQGRANKALSILLVEDDDGDAMAVKRAFTKVGFDCRVERVHDGLEALEVLRSSDRCGLWPPFIVLSDVKMPRMTGHEFMRELRGDPNLRALTVVMLSTSNAPEDVKAAYDQNVAGYIVKETSGESFTQIAQIFEAYWNMVEIL